MDNCYSFILLTVLSVMVTYLTCGPKWPHDLGKFFTVHLAILASGWYNSFMDWKANPFFLSGFLQALLTGRENSVQTVGAQAELWCDCSGPWGQPASRVNSGLGLWILLTWLRLMTTGQASRNRIAVKVLVASVMYVDLAPGVICQTALSGHPATV